MHVYEKSSGGYSPVVAQAKSGNIVSLKSPAKDSAVAEARSAQVSSAVVGASVSVDEGFEILTRKGTVEDINPHNEE